MKWRPIPILILLFVCVVIGAVLMYWPQNYVLLFIGAIYGLYYAVKSPSESVKSAVFLRVAALYLVGGFMGVFLKYGPPISTVIDITQSLLSSLATYFEGLSASYQEGIASGIVTSIIWSMLTGSLFYIYRRRKRMYAYANIINVVTGFRLRLASSIPVLYTISRSVAEKVDEVLSDENGISMEQKGEIKTRLFLFLDQLESITHWHEQVNTIYESSEECKRKTYLAVGELKVKIDKLMTLIASLNRTYDRFSDSEVMKSFVQVTDSTLVESEELNEEKLLEMDLYILNERKATVALLYGACYNALEQLKEISDKLPWWAKRKFSKQFGSVQSITDGWEAQATALLAQYPPDKESMATLVSGAYQTETY